VLLSAVLVVAMAVEYEVAMAVEYEVRTTKLHVLGCLASGMLALQLHPEPWFFLLVFATCQL
jgi:hypothetical protein